MRPPWFNIIAGGSIAVAVTVAAVGAAISWGRGAAVPPLPAGLNQADPVVAELVRRTHAQLAGDRGRSWRWLNMGMVYDAHGLDEAAIHCYEQATRLDAGDPRPWYHLAVVKSRRGEIDHAIEAMRAAVERDSGYAPACWRLGMTLVEKGEANEAERWFRRAIEIDGHDSGGWLGLARSGLFLRSVRANCW